MLLSDIHNILLHFMTLDLYHQVYNSLFCKLLWTYIVVQNISALELQLKIESN